MVGAGLSGLACAVGEPLSGGLVRSGGETIGVVTAGAWSPFLRCGTAIVRLRDAARRTAGSVTVETRAHGQQPAQLADLPLYDAEKAIPRGLGEIPDYRAA